MAHEGESWRAISAEEMQALIEKQLAECDAEGRALFQRIRLTPRKVIFDRGRFQENVFVVAQVDGKVLFFDDIEDGFEVGTPDADGVLRGVGLGQFELRHALAQLQTGSR